MINPTPINYPTNLESVNLNSFVEKNVNKYFNNFFDVPIEVSSNIDAAIIAYFEKITTNKITARALASAVIYTAIKQGFNPMQTLDEFKKLDIGELDAYTAMFLNFERKGTSYLGVSTEVAINPYIQRTIVVI